MKFIFFPLPSKENIPNTVILYRKKKSQENWERKKETSKSRSLAKLDRKRVARGGREGRCIENARLACGVAAATTIVRHLSEAARDRIGNSADGVGRRSLTRLFRGTYGHWTFSDGLETVEECFEGERSRENTIVRYGPNVCSKADFPESLCGRRSLRIQRE